MNNKEARHSSGFCYYCNNFIFRRVNPSFFFFGKHRTLLVRICVKSARRLAGADLQSAPFNRGFIIQFIKIKEAAHVGSFFKTFAKLGIRSSLKRRYKNIAMFAERSFTGHEHLDAFGLINMNGRVYDPILGRFLSPDKYVQAPGFTQSFNRYSYCLNNPLIFTDPSGNTWLSQFGDWISKSYNSTITWMNNNPMQFGFVYGDNGTIPFISFPVKGNTNLSVGYNITTGQPGIGNNSSGFTNFYNPFHAYITPEQIGTAAFQKARIEGFEQMKVAANGGGPGWEAYAGGAASIGSEMFYSKTYGTWMGKNFKMYQQSFHGSGSVGGMNKFGKTTSNAIKWGGRLVGAYSGYKTIEQRVNGEIGTGWMSAELGTTAISTFGGLYGASWGVGWELGRAVTTLDAYQEFKFNLWYNRWENQVGPPSQSTEGAWYYFYQNYGR
jgi:RHS repeat-associated protein